MVCRRSHRHGPTNHRESNVDPLDSAVVNVTVLEAGSAFNVIPDRAIIKGTVRTLSEETRLRMRDRIGEVASGVTSGPRVPRGVRLSSTTRSPSTLQGNRRGIPPRTAEARLDPNGRAGWNTPSWRARTSPLLWPEGARMLLGARSDTHPGCRRVPGTARPQLTSTTALATGSRCSAPRTPVRKWCLRCLRCWHHIPPHRNGSISLPLVHSTIFGNFPEGVLPFAAWLVLSGQCSDISHPPS